MHYSHEWIYDLRVLPAFDLVVIGMIIGMVVAVVIFECGGKDK